MKLEIKELVQACDICKRCKLETVAYPGLLQPLPIPEQAWSIYGLCGGVAQVGGQGQHFSSA